MSSPEAPAPELECAVCFNHYNNACHTPKVLPCHHTFCLQCLARIHRKAQPPDTLQCPLCRHCTRLPASGLSRLDTNLAVLACLPEGVERARSGRLAGQLWGRPKASCAAGSPQIHVSSISRSFELGPRPRQEQPRRAEQRGCGSCLHKRVRLALLAMAAVGTVVLLVSAVLLLTVPQPSRASHNLTAPSPPGGPPQGALAAGGAGLARALAKPDPVSFPFT
ncbi:E3 ubiquitin-protein ligase RNF183-like [Emydura macquarii macquarii]|uniref:E3 ubiquitin-protein ligase RNF183-like n=1 Tax=Emydura macquarii macquarii TaxID=1129001 RepID=UPI003529D4F0